MNSENAPSFIEGLTPSKEEIQYTIGPYQVLRSIGKGGMGEVLLAYDTTTGRRIALKKIRADLLAHKQIHNRFLKEATITCQLTHPAIIPIYVIEYEGETTHYTMPYVQGETLKQILRKTREQEKKGEPLDHVGGSIPALVRIFITICQAIAYAHSKGVLHRDLKPENVMIGEFGQVYILDWGLAELIDKEEDPDPIIERKHRMTNLGKVVGTISYMAPERALGQPSTIETEIYSLGVILYQILTLRNPFHRGTLKEFRKSINTETLHDPQEMAPYRDIPPVLSRITLKCLARSPKERYRSVKELITDLENYIEGRSEWFAIQELDPDEPEHWEFQEHVLIAEHVAITRATELSDWVNLMISKSSFSENTKLEATVRIGEKGNGIGFLLSVPEPAERNHLNDGFCLWIGSDKNKSTKLFKSTVEVVSAKEIFLKRGEWIKVKIEKVGSNLYFYLDNVLQFSYISHLPLSGTHVGLMSRDADFAIEDFTISVASMNLTVNCLAVPDAFLAHKQFVPALAEYRRIGYSFPGRQEGRDAMFRAGIVLLEQAKGSKDAKEREHFFEMALEEFEKLHSTPGAPLEYLGKSLIYASMGEDEEEYKCLELAFRRYRHHPLLKVLEEHISFRLHECARVNRKATYQFVLVILRHMCALAKTNHVRKLLENIKKHGEPLWFIEQGQTSLNLEQEHLLLATQVAFWLAKPYVLFEILQETKDVPLLHKNAFFALLELGCWKLLEQETISDPILACALKAHQESIQSALLLWNPSETGFESERAATHLIHYALDLGAPEKALELVIEFPSSLPIKHLKIWALLANKSWESASLALQEFSLDELTNDTSILFTLYGCFLAATEGKEVAQAHFSAQLENPHPQSFSLLGHFLNDRLGQTWMKRSFLWERKQLWRQLALYYSCMGNEAQSLFYQELNLKEEESS